MKILPSTKPIPSRDICRNCIHFQNDPATIEAVYPGLNTLSSGFASVRDQDGICHHHQLYLSARDSCEFFKDVIFPLPLRKLPPAQC